MKHKYLAIASFAASLTIYMAYAALAEAQTQTGAPQIPTQPPTQTVPAPNQPTPPQNPPFNALPSAPLQAPNPQFLPGNHPLNNLQQNQIPNRIPNQLPSPPNKDTTQNKAAEGATHMTVVDENGSLKMVPQSPSPSTTPNASGLIMPAPGKQSVAAPTKQTLPTDSNLSSQAQAPSQSSPPAPQSGTLPTAPAGAPLTAPTNDQPINNQTVPQY